MADTKGHDDKRRPAGFQDKHNWIRRLADTTGQQPLNQRAATTFPQSSLAVVVPWEPRHVRHISPRFAPKLSPNPPPQEFDTFTLHEFRLFMRDLVNCALPSTSISHQPALLQRYQESRRARLLFPPKPFLADVQGVLYCMARLGVEDWELWR